MTHSVQIPPILELMPYEVKPGTILHYERSYQFVRASTSNWSKPDRELFDVLQSISGTTDEYNQTHMGLYYTILVDKHLQRRAFMAMLATCRDNLGVVITEMNRTLGEFWPKLLLECKKNLLWLFCDLVTHNQHADAVVNHLCKRMSNGDLSSVNIWLIEYIVSFFSVPANMRWLETRNSTNPVPIALLVFTFLRLIPDHFPTRTGSVNDMSHAEQQRLTELRHKEIRFTINCLRNHWRACSSMGRELVRVLMDVARIPEFTSLWSDLVHRPRVIPGCKGVKALMKMHSNTAIIAHSVPHDAEQWLKYMIRHVKLTTCNHYLEWFQRRFLSTPESQTLRPLLIRFVVVNVHSRASEAVQAELVGRHQVVLWLVANCTPVNLVASCRLAIFFDWMLGDGRYEEVIRLFEPGLFIILRCPPVNTAPLITFLLDLIREFHPPFTAEIRASVVRVLMTLRARYNEDLTPLFKNPDLDPADRLRLEQDLGELLIVPRQASSSPQAVSGAQQAAAGGPPVAVAVAATTQGGGGLERAGQPSQEAGGARRGGGMGPGNNRPVKERGVVLLDSRARQLQMKDVTNHAAVAPPTPPVDYSESVESDAAFPTRRSERHDSTSSAHFSDECESGPTTNIDDLRRAFTNYRIRFLYRYRDVNVDIALAKLDKEYAAQLKAIQRAISDKDNPVESTEAQTNAIDALLNSETQMGMDENTLHVVAGVLCQLYLPQFESKLLPMRIDEESLMNAYSSPIFQIFRFMIPTADLPDLDPRICSLLAHMHSCQPRVGYYLLYCLKLSSTHAPISDWNAIYRQFVTALNHLPAEYQLEWTEHGGVGEVLLKHMEIVASDDPDLLVFLLPDVVDQFPAHTRNNSAFIRLIVSTVDCKQIRDLVCQVLQGHLQLLDGADFHGLLVDSLAWESIEQIFLWQLLNAHEIPTECFLPFLAKLHHEDHAEALFNLLLMFKLEKPNEELLKAVLDRPIVEEDHFSLSILHFWAERDLERLAAILDRFITDKFREKKRSKPNKAKDFPPLEQVLGHLDHMRMACKKNDILQSAQIQNALQQVHSNGGVTDELRSRFMDLFALALEPADMGGAGVSSTAGVAGASSSSSLHPAVGAGEAERPRSLRNVAARKAAEAQRRQEFISAPGHHKERRKAGGGGGAAAVGREAGDKGSSQASTPTHESSDSGSDEEAAPPRSKKRRAAPPGMLAQLSNDIFDDEA